MVYCPSSNAYVSADKIVSFQQKEWWFKQIKKVPENDYCFDCGRQNPDCVSSKNGVLICGHCQDAHKAQLGVAYSASKSIELDSWNQTELQILWNGGNCKLREFLSGYGLPGDNPYDFQEKYTTVACDYYRRWLLSQATSAPFTEQAPHYDAGRNQLGGSSHYTGSN